jgi:hypothetical protein
MECEPCQQCFSLFLFKLNSTKWPHDGTMVVNTDRVPLAVSTELAPVLVGGAAATGAPL